jgi:hypothetical protein
MIENRNRNSLLSLLPPPPKADSQDSSDAEPSSAPASRQKLEERIELALGNEARSARVILPNASEVTNLQFEARVNRTIPALGRVDAFYAKVAAASVTSANGTSHAEAIAKCKTFDLLRLEMTTENPFAPHAIALFSETGEQIGYLDSRLTNGAMRNCARWMAIFRRKNRHPETDAVIGAVVYVIHMTEPFARQHARKAALEEGAP